ncbi:protoporphyrinogen/coproporphyrinogen oxidase [Microbacterium sp. bgisy203]|uniref:protoporphyrinogen/coproporphyrinogen oxidase n=1 Tax=Microbacterium sp. bgisy203 TaxID=3413799 RepID=UPI003D71556B
MAAPDDPDLDHPRPDPQDPDLLARARRTHVAVVGGGVAGLVAALEWAKIGAHVTVLESAERFGGAVETVELDGLPVDLVADAFPPASPALHALLDELRLLPEVEDAAAHPAWIAGLPGGAKAGGAKAGGAKAGGANAGGAAPLPTRTVLGIPANPWADDVRRVIGWRGTWRAYLDRLRPPLTIGHERSLGRLVRTRMGDLVADRLVAPVTRGLYSTDPDNIDVEVAAPGLSTALTRTGSLAGAALDLLPDDEPRRTTLRGGYGRLPDALVQRLRDLGAHLRTGVRPVTLTREDAWTIALDDASTSDGVGVLVADVVILASPSVAASALLATAGIRTEPISTTLRDVVTLVVDAPALDAAPRGRAVYPLDPGPTDAVALTLPTVDWPWLAAAAGPGRHVVRVTLPADPTRDADNAATDAARAAGGLLGVAMGTPRASALRRVDAAPPASALGHAERVAAVRAAVNEHPGLAVVGASLAGSGVAQVVADTVAEVDRLRTSVLWGADRSA